MIFCCADMEGRGQSLGLNVEGRRYLALFKYKVNVSYLRKMM